MHFFNDYFFTTRKLLNRQEHINYPDNNGVLLPDTMFFVFLDFYLQYDKESWLNACKAVAVSQASLTVV